MIVSCDEKPVLINIPIIDTQQKNQLELETESLTYHAITRISIVTVSSPQLRQAV